MEKPIVPPVSEVPAVAAELAKLREVEAAEAATARELRELDFRVTNSKDPDGEDRRALAAVYLAGGALDLDAAEGVQEKRRRLARLQPIQAEAVKLQAAKVDAARNKAAAGLAKEVLPYHRNLAADVAKALCALGAANRAEVDFRDQVEAAGYSRCLPFSAFPLLGNLAEPSGPAYDFLAGLVRDGVLTGREAFLSGTAVYKGGDR